MLSFLFDVVDRVASKGHSLTAAWWSTSQSAHLYSSLGNPLEWQIGYPELFDQMGLGPGLEGPVLDYGCGPGKVAFHISERYGYEVVGCDVSADMIAIAAEENATERIRYVHIPKPHLEGFPDAGFAAALCAFVICVLEDREQHLAIAREVHRLLRPGAPFGLIVPHPDSSGVQFSTCRSGEPDVQYSAGDPMPTRLTAKGSDLLIQDYYWPTQWYEELLLQSGFTDVSASAPLPKAGEPDHAPFLVVTGKR